MKNTKMISLLVPIISVILAFLIGCIIMAALSANPAVALGGRLRQRKEHRHHALPLHPADIHRPLRLLCL